MASQTPSFKAYHQEQIMLLPPSLDELVPQGHPVRVVNEVIDKIDLTVLLMHMRAKDAQVTIQRCYLN